MGSKNPPGTETLYARVPREVKRSVEAYAEDKSLSLANAVSELLAQALDMIPHYATESAIAVLLAMSGMSGSTLDHPCVMDPEELSWRVQELARQVEQAADRLKRANT